MKIGLALGGGAARGYAHIPVLEAFDDLGIVPYRISGTSIGAIIGAIYAAGVSGAELRQRMREATVWKDDRLRDVAKKRELLRWFLLLIPDAHRGGLVRSDKIVESITRELGVATFEELQIPLSVVATDLWRCEEVVFKSGELVPALRASMAIPGVFAPVQHEGRLLVDGAVTDLVPYSLLLDECDLTVAINITHVEPEDRADPVRAPEVLRRTLDLVQEAATARRIEHRPPDIYLAPDLGDVSPEDFHRAETVLERADPLREELRDALAALLEQREGG